MEGVTRCRVFFFFFFFFFSGLMRSRSGMGRWAWGSIKMIGKKLFLFTFSLYAALAHDTPAEPLAPLGFRTWTRAEVTAMQAATGTTTLKTSPPMASTIVSSMSSSLVPCLPFPPPPGASSEKSSLGGERLRGVPLMEKKRATEVGRGRAGLVPERVERKK